MTDEGTVRFDLSDIGAQEPAPGDPRRIGAFPIHAVLGSGGMGRVYLGLAPTGYAAVKQVLPALAHDPVFLRHFGQELDNQARLPSGVSARLLAADRTAQPPWFATEYVPGVTLHDAVHLSGGALPTATVWALLRELAQRLAKVAALEMVHRDLKPSNVMLTGQGVTLIDFGVARAADQSSVTATGLAVGTPAYMAPEQARARKNLTPAVDVFALGGMLAFAVTGEAPFGDGSGADLFYRVIHADPDLDAVRERDPALADVVASCLAKDPADRPTAAALAERAQRHAEPGPPAWPTAVSDLITVRRAFALSAPKAPLAPAARNAAHETELEIDEPSTPPSAPVQTPPSTPPSAPAQAAPSTPPSEPSALTQTPASGKRTRRRRAVVLLLPIVLVAGTGGTLAALHIAPFVTSPASGSPGTGSRLAGGSGTTGAASIPASAGYKSTAAPTHAPSGSAGAGSASALPGGGGGGGASTTHTTRATQSSGGSAGSAGGSSDPAVVATSYSEIKNVAQGLCIGNQYGTNNTIATPMTCDGDAGEGWQTLNKSGADFSLVEKNTGACLFDYTSSNGSVAIFMCSTTDAAGLWHVGATTAKGGELVNVGSGRCLAYTYTYQKSLTTAACDSADTAELWYDAGRI